MDDNKWHYYDDIQMNGTQLNDTYMNGIWQNGIQLKALE
jgi:hypothetical protein